MVLVGGIMLGGCSAPQGTSENTLLDNRTRYIGEAFQVSAILQAIPYAEDLVWGGFTLSTEEEKKGATVSFTAEQGWIGRKEDFFDHAVFFFAFIQNADWVTYEVAGEDEVVLISYTRSEMNRYFEEEVWNYSASQEELEALQKAIPDAKERFVQEMKLAIEIELHLASIMENPMVQTESNPERYIEERPKDFAAIVLLGESALGYLVSEEEQDASSLRGYLLRRAEEEIIADRIKP